MSPYRPSLIRPAEMAASLTSKAATRDHHRGQTRTNRNKQNVTEVEQSAAAKEAHRQHIQSERLRTFRLAGHPVRRGDEDDTTAVPALIPIPSGFGASEAAEEGQKSFVAGRIMEALRASQADSVTGRKAKIAVPLWHRATEEIDSSNTGSILYSDLIGHTYSVLVGPKRVAGNKTG